MGFADYDIAAAGDEVIWLKNWEHLLGEMHEAESLKRQKRNDIFQLLRVCKVVRRPISVGLIKWYLDRAGLESVKRTRERDSLSWFYQMAKKQVKLNLPRSHLWFLPRIQRMLWPACRRCASRNRI